MYCGRMAALEEFEDFIREKVVIERCKSVTNYNSLFLRVDRRESIRRLILMTKS